MITDNSTIAWLKDEASRLHYPNRKNAFNEYEKDCNFILTDASRKNFFIQIWENVLGIVKDMVLRRLRYIFETFLVRDFFRYKTFLWNHLIKLYIYSRRSNVFKNDWK